MTSLLSKRARPALFIGSGLLVGAIAACASTGSNRLGSGGTGGGSGGSGTSGVGGNGKATGSPTGSTSVSTSGTAVGSTSTSTAASSSSSGAPDTCAHSPCTAGVALTSGCDACATAVCAQDSYCCNTSKTWDAQCVMEVAMDCGASYCSGTAASSSSTTTTSSSTGSTSGGVIGPTGGTVASLNFAIVGDTRPPNEDDTSGYPTPIITKIWQDVQALSPRPDFALTTGDYMFASPSHNPGTQATQMGYYMSARNIFSNTVFPVMGNHECDGSTTDNCGPCTSGSQCNSVSGSCIGGFCQTPNFQVFQQNLLQPIGQTNPYYVININGTGGAWTSKFVFVACNNWSSTQASWLASTMAKSTTFTFVVRHMGTTATTAPCLSGTGSNNADSIIANYPYTLLIAGHTHEYAYYSSEKQVIVGNGGAPLTNTSPYGYVVGRQSGSVINFTSYEYDNNAVVENFTVP